MSFRSWRSSESADVATGHAGHHLGCFRVLTERARTGSDIPRVSVVVPLEFEPRLNTAFKHGNATHAPELSMHLSSHNQSSFAVQLNPFKLTIDFSSSSLVFASGDYWSQDYFALAI